MAAAAAAGVLIGRHDSTATAVRLLDDEGDTIRLSKPLLLPSAAARLRRICGSTAATAAAARKARLNKHCCELGDAAVAAYTLQACDAEAALAWQGTSPLPLRLLLPRSSCAGRDGGRLRAALRTSIGAHEDGGGDGHSVVRGVSSAHAEEEGKADETFHTHAQARRRRPAKPSRA